MANRLTCRSPTFHPEPRRASAEYRDCCRAGSERIVLLNLRPRRPTTARLHTVSALCRPTSGSLHPPRLRDDLLETEVPLQVPTQGHEPGRSTNLRPLLQWWSEPHALARDVTSESSRPSRSGRSAALGRGSFRASALGPRAVPLLGAARAAFHKRRGARGCQAAGARRIAKSPPSNSQTPAGSGIGAVTGFLTSARSARLIVSKAPK